MKFGNAIRIFIVCVIIGGFAGWGVAWIAGKGNAGQSKGTGRGCAGGAVAGLLCIGGVALIGGKKNKTPNG